VVHLVLPPLRERGDDVVLLARTFAAQLAARYGLPEPRLTAEVRTSLVAHGWPGNVRELRHAVERALLLSPPGEILAQELAPSGTPAGAPRSDTALAFPARLADVVHDAAQSAVALCDGNKSAAARLLGISRARLQRLLQREDTHDADAE
jgi:DNA-binding NtrC family response regulator